MDASTGISRVSLTDLLSILCNPFRTDFEAEQETFYPYVSLDLTNEDEDG